MQEQWVFKYKSEEIPCGFGYNIKLVNEKIILRDVKVNIDCKYMSGWVYFPKSYLEDYKDKFIRLSDNEVEKFSKQYCPDGYIPLTSR